MNKSENNARKRGWPSCLIDSDKLEGLLTNKGRPMRWLWSGDGPGRIDAKTGMRIEQRKQLSIRTIFKIASRLECDPTQLVNDADAKMIIETARGHIKISDLAGLWGGHPGGDHTTEDHPQHEFTSGARDDLFNSPHIRQTDEGFIPIWAEDCFMNSGDHDVVLALRPVTVTTIASKPSAYELTAILSRHSRAPKCDPDKQRISLNTEPLVVVHDVDAHKDVTKQLVELFHLSRSVIDDQRIFPSISESEEHETIRSKVQDYLNWLATRNIQVLDAGITTVFAVRFDDGSEAFAWFSRPILILAPTTLIDIELKYPRLELATTESFT